MSTSGMCKRREKPAQNLHPKPAHTRQTHRRAHTRTCTHSNPHTHRHANTHTQPHTTTLTHTPMHPRTHMRARHTPTHQRGTRVRQQSLQGCTQMWVSRLSRSTLSLSLSLEGKALLIKILFSSLGEACNKAPGDLAFAYDSLFPSLVEACD